MTAAAVVKIVLTHRAAARAKYGRNGWSAIRHAVTALIAADKVSGLQTRFLALDSAADARRVGATRVEEVSDSEATKAFVDAVFTRYDPAYLVLLGGPELVATVPLSNPLWDGSAEGDPDPVIASDLPYACSVPFSTSPSAYAGATRVVSRIPDLVGVPDRQVLVGQLQVAAQAVPAAVPTKVFALSARTWRSSTTTSISTLPVPTGTVRTSPSEGPAWSATDLAPLVHFVNCHGGEFDPHWYGEARPGAQSLPIAIDGSTLTPKIARGTVVAAECCYGTAHWAPAVAGDASSVAMTYLTNGAVGFFGAATTAYGPSSGNAYADVIAGYFAAAVLGGASLGRAGLIARQRYVQAEAYLDPTSLTTLAQFTLFGDPSLQPFRAAAVSGPSAPTPSAPDVALKSGGVAQRRAQLMAIGNALQASTAVSADVSTRAARLSAGDLASLSAVPAVEQSRVRTFAANGPASANLRSHVAFVTGTQGRTLVVVRESPSGREVRVVHAKTEPVTLTGTVSLRRIAIGSKSERDSVVLATGERHWELRRGGAGAFDPPDRVLLALAGRTVTLTGYAGSGVFVVTDLPTSPPP